jgi:hypothetical protein
MTPGLCCSVGVAQDSGPRGMLQVVQVMDRLPTACVTSAPPPIVELGRPPLRLTCPLQPTPSRGAGAPPPVQRATHHVVTEIHPIHCSRKPHSERGPRPKTYRQKTRTASPSQLSSASLTTCRSYDANRCCQTHAQVTSPALTKHVPITCHHLPTTCPSPAHHLPITCPSPAHHLPITGPSECI